jgi:hypothetical protein
MKKTSLTVLISLSVLAGAAYAQDGDRVESSTDPAKIADIEQRAQALQSQQQMQQEAPERPAMQHKRMHHHKKSMKKEESSGE